jgi:glyceraldehyde 3-phosphate dehydrogenase
MAEQTSPQFADQEAITADPIRVGINGFGRIGRNFFRANMAQGNPIEIVATNDLGDNQQLADLLKFDSVYGRLDADVAVDENGILVDGQLVRVLGEREPTKLPWDDLGVDVVIESTGYFTTSDKAVGHLEAGAKKVIVSAPADGENIATVVMGINEGTYDPDRHDILSNASCTTNCLAPLATVLYNKFGFDSGLMTTIHAYTADQNLQDGPHPDRRRARAAAINMVPASSGAAKAIGLVLPDLVGRLHGAAIRVPNPVGSLTELTVVSSAQLQIDEINEAYRQAAADGPLKGILKYSEDPLVSSDIVGDPHSSVYDSGLTMVLGNQTRVSAWYDNEWGFSNRLVELAKYVGNRLTPADD